NNSSNETPKVFAEARARSLICWRAVISSMSYPSLKKWQTISAVCQRGRAGRPNTAPCDWLAEQAIVFTALGVEVREVVRVGRRRTTGEAVAVLDELDAEERGVYTLAPLVVLHPQLDLRVDV